MGNKYYAVKNGRETGVFNNWNDCKNSTSGYSGASFKSFGSAHEAQQFVSGSGGHSSGSSSANYPTRISTGLALVIPPGSRNEGGGSSYGGGYSYSGSARPVANASHQPVWTDGASRRNGAANASAGYGVYYGEGDSRNEYGKLNQGPQTNQRAELQAVNRALEKHSQSGDSRDLKIYTDSEYAIKSLTIWGDKWEQNGYKNSKGGPVSNQDLIQYSRSLIEELGDRGTGVEFEHVPGHAGNPGNEAADRLAGRGADL